MKKLIIHIFVLLEILCLPKNEKTKRKVQNEKSDDIAILHTNDVHCGVQDTIGYDGLMLYKKQLLEKYNNVLLVDAGDHIQGGTIGLITNGEAIIDIMNKLEYDVVTLGNHEFDYGLKQLEFLGGLLNSSYISCNYCHRKNKTAIYPPYKIIEIGGKKIGFIGVATPETITKSYLITLVDDNKELIYDFLIGNHTHELYERVQQHVDYLKGQNVDYIILLAHLGIGRDVLEENTSANLLKNLKDVNALIDGHTHLVYSQTTSDKDGNQVTLAQTGTKLTNIGVLIIHQNGTISHKNINEVPYDPNLADQTLNVTRGRILRYVDKEMYDYINYKFDLFSDELNRVVGYSPFLLNVYKNASESTQSQTQISRWEENAFCNLICDSIRKYGEADITIMNAGTVRRDINQGNITYQDVINTMPFSNDILAKQITGQTILDALEFGVRLFPNPYPLFPQVSGITYKIDTSINSSVVIDENEVFQGVKGERRVYDVKVNGVNVDVKKNYTISTNSYLLEGGGGYSMFTNFVVTKTSVGVDNEVLLKYIQTDLEGFIPNKYKKSEGRIVKTKGKIKNGDSNNIHLSLLGFNNLNISNQFIRFNTYFISLENIEFEFSKQMSLNTSIFYSNLRVLAEEETIIPCFIEDEIISGIKGRYTCEIESDASSINTIQIKNITHGNFEIRNSPYASKYMGNLINTLNKKELLDLDNKTIYVLNNASYKKNGENSLTITGSINNNDSISFNKNELSLIASQLSNDDYIEIKCKNDGITDKKYNFTCLLNDSIECQLDNSMVIDDDKILLIDFEEGAESEIVIKPNSTNRKNTRYFRKSSGGLNVGLISLIVIIPIISIIITVVSIILLRKSNNPEIVPNSNTKVNLSIS